MYGISRREAGGNPHWRVRFSRRGKEYSERFYDHRQGGHDAALLAAQAWRNNMLGRVGAMTKAEFSALRHKNNTSGYAGVFLVTRYCKRRDGSVYEYACWEARTPKGMKPVRCCSFGIEKYGFDEAYIHAVTARMGFLENLEGEHLPRVPEQYRKSRNENGR